MTNQKMVATSFSKQITETIVPGHVPCKSVLLKLWYRAAKGWLPGHRLTSKIFILPRTFWTMHERDTASKLVLTLSLNILLGNILQLREVVIVI